MNKIRSNRLWNIAVLIGGSSLCIGTGRLAAQALPPAVPKQGAVAPATQPTMDMAQAALDAREYSTAIKLAGKVLALHGAAAGGSSRFQVTMLKGEAQAGLKSISAAVLTFKSAAKETRDVREIALSRWTAELFHTAGATLYTPKLVAVGVPKRGPFDLMVPEQRKQAFGALLDDSLSALDPKLKVAAVSQNLPQIWPVLQQVIDLDQLDVIANGNDDKTTTLASSLLDHSRNLLSNALKAYWARLGDIDSHANQTTTTTSQLYVNNSLVNQSTTRKNGLSEANKSELNNMIAMSQKIHDAASVFMSVAKTDTGWSTIQSDADRVAGKASDVLNADYGDAVTSSSDTTGAGYGIPPGNTFGAGTGGVSAQQTTQTPPPKRSNAPGKPADKTNTPKTGN